jgi:HEAT repeat protein
LVPTRRSAIPELAKLLDDRDPARMAALQTLARLGQHAVPALCEGLKNKKPTVRYWSAFTLGVIGPDAREAVPALAVALEDSEPRVRLAVAGTLGEFGPDAREAIPALVRCLRSSSRDLQVQAADALISIGPAGVPALVDLLQDKNALVRASAIYVLGQMGEGARDATPALAKALFDRELTNRSLAALSLGQIGPEAKAAIQPLRDLLNSSDKPSIRVAAAMALTRIDSDEAKAIERFRLEMAKAYGPPSAAMLAQWDLRRQVEVERLIDFFVWITSFNFGDGLKLDAHRMVARLGPEAIPAMARALNVLQENPEGRKQILEEGAPGGERTYFVI